MAPSWISELCTLRCARAEWIKAGACDMVRGGVSDVGGITPLIKIAHLAEAFGMQPESVKRRLRT